MNKKFENYVKGKYDKKAILEYIALGRDDISDLVIYDLIEKSVEATSASIVEKAYNTGYNDRQDSEKKKLELLKYSKIVWAGLLAITFVVIVVGGIFSLVRSYQINSEKELNHNIEMCANGDYMGCRLAWENESEHWSNHCLLYEELYHRKTNQFLIEVRKDPNPNQN